VTAISGTRSVEFSEVSIFGEFLLCFKLSAGGSTIFGSSSYSHLLISGSMPVAVQSSRNIQMVRDPAFYGLDKEKKHKKSKPIPYVDVSDDDDKPKINGLKRKASVANGQSDHTHNSPNGQKHKKRRHSVQENESIQWNGVNDAGPSHPKGIINGAASSMQAGAKVRAIQEQRKGLPITKGFSLFSALHNQLNVSSQT